MKQGEGIAICTSFDNFKKAITDQNIEVNGGLVEYVDYNTYSQSEFNILTWATLKRKSFEHEREFRGIALDIDPDLPGVNVNVNIDILIDQIYLSPATPVWVNELMQNMLDRYGLDKNITLSSLRDGPDYY